MVLYFENDHIASIFNGDYGTADDLYSWLIYGRGFGKLGGILTN